MNPNDQKSSADEVGMNSDENANESVVNGNVESTSDDNGSPMSTTSSDIAWMYGINNYAENFESTDNDSVDEALVFDISTNAPSDCSLIVHTGSQSSLNPELPFDHDPEQDAYGGPSTSKAGKENGQKPCTSKTAREDVEKPCTSKSVRQDRQKPCTSKTVRNDVEKPGTSKAAREDAEKPCTSKAVRENAEKPCASNAANENDDSSDTGNLSELS